MTRARSRLSINGSKYSDEVKREAIGAFVIMGNLRMVSEHLGIPAKTVQDWSRRGWWLEETARIQEQKSQELDMSLSISMEMARKSVDERFEVGDPYITKDGKVAYKPVSCRDSVVAFGVLYDKLALTRNKPTKIIANQDLTKLQATFEALVTQREAFNDTVVSEQGIEP